MSASATVVAVAAALQKGWKAFCNIVTFKRRQMADAELVAENGKGKDLDGDGIVGGVGNTRRTRDEWLRSSRLDGSADEKR